MSRRVRIVIAAIVTAALACGLAVGVGFAVRSGDEPVVAHADPLHQGPLSTAEYIEAMIPHHQLAVAMSRIALERTGRPNVKGLAYDIISGQSYEIALMRQWRQELLTPEQREAARPTPGELEAVNVDDTLRSLERTRTIDYAFLAEMIPHHASALVMSKRALAGDQPPEIRAFAERVIAGQAKEIGLMQAYREEWYPEGP
jgi:uncharacterized protein (DUF305 family)